MQKSEEPLVTDADAKRIESKEDLTIEEDVSISDEQFAGALPGGLLRTSFTYTGCIKPKTSSLQSPIPSTSTAPRASDLFSPISRTFSLGQAVGNTTK